MYSSLPSSKISNNMTEIKMCNSQKLRSAINLAIPSNYSSNLWYIVVDVKNRAIVTQMSACFCYCFVFCFVIASGISRCEPNTCASISYQHTKYIPCRKLIFFFKETVHFLRSFSSDTFSSSVPPTSSLLRTRRTSRSLIAH